MNCTLELPYPPSANRYWRNFRGRTVISAEAQAYRDVVNILARRQYQGNPTESPVAVSMIIRRPARRRDLDNHFKVMLDALQNIIYVNDGQIFRLNAEMIDDKKRPGVTVTVSEIEE